MPSISLISVFQDIYSDQISQFSPTIVDVKNIQLSLDLLLNITSILFERNSQSRLQNVAIYQVCQMSPNRRVEDISKRGKS